MEQTVLIVHDGVVVPESALVRREKVNRYGSVPGLADEELADPDELERQVMLQEWGPVLAVPVRRASGFRPELDEDGVRCDAFATVDFERTMPAIDKTRYRAERRKEERRNVLIALDIVKRRVPGRAKYRVLEYVRKGVLDVGEVVDFDMYQLAELDLRARRLQQEIASLEEARRRRQEKAVEAMFGKW